MAVSNLLGGLAIDQQMDSDLFAGGDGRICKTIVRADFGAKINASYSFKPSTMQCLGCQPRHQLATGTRAVFVLSDQDFPPALPCQNGGQCLFIFRMENGSLSELVDDFLEMTKGWRLPPGSVAIAISISQLSRCGTAAYAASLAHNGGRIQKAFSGNVEWIPGVPILACGSNNKELIRSLLEISNWIRFCLQDSPTTLEGTFGLLADEIRSNPTRGGKGPEERRLTMPSLLSEFPNMKTWASDDHLIPLPSSIAAFNEKTEEILIGSMIDELNSKLGLALDPKPSFSRGIDKYDAAQYPPGGYLVIGSSNASRTADALKQAGQGVTLIKTTNWKPTPAGIISITDHVREAQKNANHKATVFHLLDNILYMGRKPDGTTAHSKRMEDGMYHIEGELVVADKEAQFTLYKALKPALTAAGSGPILVVTPLPRYVKKGCCTDNTHVTNRTKADFYSDLSRSLTEVRNNWRTFLFVDNLRRISVINPLPLFDNLPEDEGWGPDDPVHPLPPVHRELANLIIRNAEYLASKPATGGERSGAGSSLGTIQRRPGREWTGTGGGWRPANPGRGRGHWDSRPGSYRSSRGHRSHHGTRCHDEDEEGERRRPRFY